MAKKFDPNNLPELPTAIFDSVGKRIGTFNPHTLIIHPMGDTVWGPLKLLGGMAFDMRGNLIGKFNSDGDLEAATQAEAAII